MDSRHAYIGCGAAAVALMFIMKRLQAFLQKCATMREQEMLSLLRDLDQDKCAPICHYPAAKVGKAYKGQ